MSSLTVEDSKFPLGEMVMTRGVADMCATDPKFAVFVLQSLGRHSQGDWGELSQEDINENEYSLRRGFRLLSAYEPLQLPPVWIITEADRSATTVLFPEEY